MFQVLCITYLINLQSFIFFLCLDLVSGLQYVKKLNLFGQYLSSYAFLLIIFNFLINYYHWRFFKFCFFYYFFQNWDSVINFIIQDISFVNFNFYDNQKPLLGYMRIWILIHIIVIHLFVLFLLLFYLNFYFSLINTNSYYYQ
jgi:hypothetical protein